MLNSYRGLNEWPESYGVLILSVFVMEKGHEKICEGARKGVKAKEGRGGGEGDDDEVRESEWMCGVSMKSYMNLHSKI